MIFPESLKAGDKIAIISPSTTVKGEYIEGAAALLRDEGFEPVVMPHAYGPADGTFAASRAARIADFHQAWAAPDVRAVLCARGGYGAVDLLGEFDPDFLRLNAKWLIGFSDITALHAMLLNAGIASIHGPMAKHMTLLGASDPCVRSLLHILREGLPVEYKAETHPLNIEGQASGRLIGGNMAVFGGLSGSEYDIFRSVGDDDLILFVEDISEKIYAVERMFHRMRLSGAFRRIKGLLIGQFTEYNPDRNHPSMEVMVARFLHRYGLDTIPVAYGFPVGHVDDNRPLVQGSVAHLSVTSSAVSLIQQTWLKPSY